MFAALAAVAFGLDLIGVAFTNMVVLGLFLLALHHAIGVPIPWRPR